MNPDIANAKPHVLAALRKANSIIGIGDVHGWPRPQAYVDALAMLNAAREIERTVVPLPPAPEKPKDLKRWVDATVAVRHEELTRRDVIVELASLGSATRRQPAWRPRRLRQSPRGRLR